MHFKIERSLVYSMAHNLNLNLKINLICIKKRLNM